MIIWHKKQNSYFFGNLLKSEFAQRKGKSAKNKVSTGIHSKCRIYYFVPLDSISSNLQRMTPIKMLNINKTSVNLLQNEF